MTEGLTDRLVACAMALAGDAFDDAAAAAELCRLAGGDAPAVDEAITACMALRADLATRRRAVELLAKVRYAPGQHHHDQED